MFAGLALVLAGCAVGPSYKRPAADAPPAFRGETPSSATNSFADLPWWQVFQDETLQGLIRSALTNNFDVRIAVSRVEQAHELALQARSQYYPQLTYTGLAGRAKNAVGNSPSPTGVTGDEFYAAGVASWDIDLWGRLRRLNESARAQYLATEEARRGVSISVVSQVAQSWFQLRALHEELQIARDASNSFGDSFKIFSDRLQGGVASRLETSSAEALQAAAAAAIPALEERIAMQENEISVLLGRPPGPVPGSESSLTNATAPEIPAGLPSSLLERRPDIRQAEQLLRSANAQVGVTVANYFPNLSLTALFGRVSPQLSALTGGSANAWGLAADVAGPIFEGGLLTSQHRQAQAAWNQARLQYQATVLHALQEVSDTLIAGQKLAEARVQQARAVAAYQEAVAVATQRYREGQASYYEVLQEQQLLFPAENALVETGLNQRLATIQLYEALGGGWGTDRN
jgi:multidrug efflux system outer membrane protein